MPNNSLSERRLRNLSRLVVKYYLKYYRTTRSIGILNVLTGMPKKGVDIDDKVRNYIAMLIADSAVKDMTKAIMDALNDYIRYREFRVLYDNQIWGVLSIPHTLVVYPARIYASLTYVPSSRSPEYILLSEMARDVYDNAKKVLGSLEITNLARDSPNHDYLIREIKRIRDTISRNVDKLGELINKDLINLLPKPGVRYSHQDIEKEFNRLKTYAPYWLRKAYRSYILSLRAKGILKSMKIVKLKFQGSDAILLAWRLYEHLVYFLTLDILHRDLGFKIKIDKSKPRKLFLSNNERKIALVYNEQLPFSKIECVGDCQGEDDLARKMRGRPDVTIYDCEDEDCNKPSKLIVAIECKFSVAPYYTTTGRFKVMAYMHEYGAKTGILVIPGIEKRGWYDEEERSTVYLRDKLEVDGYVKVKLSDNATIYLVKIDPGEKGSLSTIEDNLRKRLSNIITKIIESA